MIEKHTYLTLRAELAALVLILLIAAAFRIPGLDRIPPGLQHDEIFYAQDAAGVQQGHRPIYFASNNGREPLYIYLMAGTLSIFGHNALGIRMASVICGMLTVLFIHLWGREAWNARVGLIGAALTATTLWPIFISRTGLRAVSLPMAVAMVGWLFARALNRGDAPQAWRAWLIAGGALGLTEYTYLAARVVPGGYGAFFILTLFTGRPNIRRTWCRWLIFGAAALLIFAPLGWYLLNTPGVEARFDQLGGPLDDLKAGDPGPLIDGTLRTLGMFTFEGDPVWRYNVAGRPVFGWGVGLLFYIGVVWCIRHRRAPQSALLIIGLAVALTPSAATPTPPAFLRAGAALPAAMLLPALGAEWLMSKAAAWHAAPHSGGLLRKAGPKTFVLLLIVVIGIAGVSTAKDYFRVWPSESEVIAAYRGDLRAAAAWIDAARPDRPVVIGTSEPHHLDPFIFDYTPHGDADLRWVDAMQALVLPEGGASAVYISPATTPFNPRLTAMFFGQAAPTQPRRLPGGASAFALYDLDTQDAVSRVLEAARSPVYVSDAAAFPTADPRGWATRLDYPVCLDGRLDFLGYTHDETAQAGENLNLVLFFRPMRDSSGVEPLAIFAHLLTSEGELAAGRDFLAVPARDWRAGDVFVQLHDLWLDPMLPSGAYVLEVGVYSQADMRRFAVRGSDGVVVGDRLILAPVVLK